MLPLSSSPLRKPPELSPLHSRRLSVSKFLATSLFVIGLLTPSLVYAQQVDTSSAVAKASAIQLTQREKEAAKALDLSPECYDQVKALFEEKARRTPAQQKITSNLLFASRMLQGKSIARGISHLETNVKVDMVGRVPVEIRATVSQDLLNLITAAGGTVHSAIPSLRSIYATVSLNWLETLAARKDVTWIEYGNFPGGATGNVDSQGDTTHKAIQARSLYGVDGTGVKVGVLSTSDRYRENSQTTSDLGTVTVIPGQDGRNTGSNNTGEGTAMMEIVHDLAPGAQLFFASGVTGFAQFAQNVRDLRNVYHCDVLIDDIFWTGESPFSDDLIAQAVNDVTADGAIYFSFAGNWGSATRGTASVWEGDFVDGGPIAFNSVGEVGRVHKYDNTGAGLYNTSNVTSGFGIALQWSDPLDASSNDYDVVVTNNTGTSVVSASGNTQNGTQQPKEFAALSNGNRIYVIAYTGDSRTPEPRALHLATNINGSGFSALGRVTSGSLANHAQADDAISVSAAPAVGPFPNFFTLSSQAEYFTADGPRRKFYNQSGFPITPGNLLFGTNGGKVLAKPEITAADGVSTTTPGFQPFYGTSAAAPHAGAIGTLLKSLNYNSNGLKIQGIKLTTAEMKTTLFNTALNISGNGVDSTANTGHGIIMAPAALQYLLNFVSIQTITAVPVSSTSATIQWTTDLPSSTVVDYGTTAGYGITVTGTPNVTNHSLTLTGLTPGTTYHYRIRTTTVSTAADYTSGDYTFVTSSAASTPAIRVTVVTLARAGNVQATVTLTNSGTATATALTLKSASIGTSNTTTIVPFTIGGGSLSSGSSATFTLTFPNSTAAGSSTLKIVGAYSGGSFTSSVRVVVP